MRDLEYYDVFQQVRINEIPLIEVDTGDGVCDFIFRLLVVSQVGQHMALELKFENFQELLEAAGATQKRFPGGRLVS